MKRHRAAQRQAQRLTGVCFLLVRELFERFGDRRQVDAIGEDTRAGNRGRSIGHEYERLLASAGDVLRGREQQRSFEYYQTSFSYTLQESGEERFVGVPEQGGRDLISTDPLPPGTAYSAGVTADGTVGLYRLEVSVASGTGKLKMAGGVSGATKESIQRAFAYLQSKKSEFSVARDLDSSDFHVEVIDLLNNRVEAELGVAFFVACFSAIRKAPLSPGLLVLGDMSIQGNIKPLRSLVEPLQVAMDNGGKRALIPIENKRSFLEVSADIVEHVDPIFYGDPKTAALKVMGG